MNQQLQQRLNKIPDIVLSEDFLNKKGLGLLSAKNELIWFNLASVVLACLMGLFFTLLGSEFLLGVGFFLAQISAPQARPAAQRRLNPHRHDHI